MTVVAADGVTGRLVVHGLWGELRDVEGEPGEGWLDAAAARAVEAGALDLRVTADPDGRWGALGFAPLDPSWPELVRPLEVPLEGVEATRALGARLAAAVRPGDLLVLSGPLGAGKTALTQGLGAALGVRGAVTSPTFVLARAHRGPLPLLHVDAYRLRESGGGTAVLADLDLEQALADSVVVVEWGEGLVEDLADARLHVVLDRPAASAVPDRRTVRVRAHGTRWALAPGRTATAREGGGGRAASSGALSS